MTDKIKHAADAPEQEITSETPEFANELAASTTTGATPTESTTEAAGAESTEADLVGAGDASQAPSESAGERPAPRLERLQKILAQAGVASRRHAEELITGGRVQVNGQTVTVLGSKADPDRDHIRVDGKLLRGAERLRYFVLNKPKGFVTTVTDPEGRPTVMQFFSKMGERLYPVGRLDYQSEGLLLVTNDGELANQLTKAASGVEKTYVVKVSGQPAEDELDRLRAGIAIDRGRPQEGRVSTAPARVRQIRKGENPWYEIVLIEGRNRELRKMFEEIGHHVEKIRRVGYGPLILDVEPGKVRELDAREVQALRLTAEGKIRPRRPKSNLMLPREAGQSTEQRMAKEAARREKKFQRPYPRDDRRTDSGVRPRERSVEPRGAAPPRTGSPRADESRTGGPRAGRIGTDFRPPSREGTRPSPGRPSQDRPFHGRPSSGTRVGGFKVRPTSGERPPRADARFRGDRPKTDDRPPTGGKARFGHRPPSFGARFRGETPQGATGRPRSERPPSNSGPAPSRGPGFSGDAGRGPSLGPGRMADRAPNRTGGSPARREPTEDFVRPGPSRSRLDIRPVEPHDRIHEKASDREKTSRGPRSGPKIGPGTGRRAGTKIGSGTDGPPRRHDSVTRFRGGAGPARPPEEKRPARPPGKTFGKGPAGGAKPGFSSRSNKPVSRPGSRPPSGFASRPALGARPQGAGSSPTRFKKKSGGSRTNRIGPARGGKRPGTKKRG
jgi:23S rRNA pseudouridine2605 synthase